MSGARLFNSASKNKRGSLQNTVSQDPIFLANLMRKVTDDTHNSLQNINSDRLQSLSKRYEVTLQNQRKQISAELQRRDKELDKLTRQTRDLSNTIKTQTVQLRQSQKLASQQKAFANEKLKRPLQRKNSFRYQTRQPYTLPQKRVKPSQNQALNRFIENTHENEESESEMEVEGGDYFQDEWSSQEDDLQDEPNYETEKKAIKMEENHHAHSQNSKKLQRNKTPSKKVNKFTSQLYQ